MKIKQSVPTLIIRENVNVFNGKSSRIHSVKDEMYTININEVDGIRCKNFTSDRKNENGTTRIIGIILN